MIANNGKIINQDSSGAIGVGLGDAVGVGHVNFKVSSTWFHIHKKAL